MRALHGEIGGPDEVNAARWAKDNMKTLLLGPNCPGVITPDELKIGIIISAAIASHTETSPGIIISPMANIANKTPQ